MNIKSIFKSRESIPIGSMYRWTLDRYSHIMFKKVSPLQDEIYYKYDLFGTLRFDDIAGRIHIRAHYHLNDFNHLNGYHDVSYSMDIQGEHCLENFYLYKGFKNNSYKSLYSNNKKPIYKINPPSITNNFTGSFSNTEETPVFEEYSQPKEKYIELRRINSSELIPRTPDRWCWGIPITPIPFMSTVPKPVFPPSFKLTPESDSMELYDLILRDITEHVTISPEFFAPIYSIIWNDNNPPKLFTYKLAHYITFLKRFRKYFDFIDFTAFISKNNFFDLSFRHSIIIGELDFEIKVTTFLFDRFEYNDKDYDLEGLDALLSKYKRFPYTVYRQVTHLIHNII